MKSGQQTEVEIKLRISNLEDLTRRMHSLGFVQFSPREFEANVIYDTVDGSMRARGELIRIRQWGGRCLVTFKGPGKAGRHKEREEIELSVDDGSAMDAILKRLGLAPKFRYEKYRSEWKRDQDEGVAMVDETPIGTYLELEGPGTWIDRTAIELGYSEDDYISQSYGRLFDEYCRSQGYQAGDMVFDGVRAG